MHDLETGWILQTRRKEFEFKLVCIHAYMIDMYVTVIIKMH